MWWARLLNNVVAVYAPQVPPVTNSYESIATVTVGSGGVASINFASIPSTFKHLQLRISSNINHAATYVTIAMRVGNGTVDSGANYAYHDLYGTGAAAGAQAATSQDRMYIGWAAGTTVSSSGAVILDILDYANTSKNKTARSLTGIDGNGSGIVSLESNLWMSTSAINIITLFPQSGSLFNQNSVIALYGIKG